MNKYLVKYVYSFISDEKHETVIVNRWKEYDDFYEAVKMFNGYIEEILEVFDDNTAIHIELGFIKPKGGYKLIEEYNHKGKKRRCYVA